MSDHTPLVPAAAEMEAERSLSLLAKDLSNDNAKSMTEHNRSLVTVNLSVAKLNEAKAFLRYAIGLAGLWLALVASVALVVWAVR